MPVPPGLLGASVLVRIRADEAGHWVSGLPPVPTGAVITVTGTSAAITDSVSDLERRGYRFAGVAVPPVTFPPAEFADLLVGTHVVEDHPEWWSSVTDAAWRVLPLLHGPVARVFAPVVAAHRTARRTRSRPGATRLARRVLEDGADGCGRGPDAPR